MFKKLLKLMLAFDRRIQRGLQMGFDGLAVFLALTIAMLLRLESFSFLKQSDFFVSFVLILFPTIFVFAALGLYRAFMRYVSTEIAVLVALGSSFSAVLVITAKLLLAPFIPWSIPIIYAALLFIAVTGSRFMLRSLFRAGGIRRRKYLAIYGAGAAGAQIVQSLKSSSDYQVRMIIDDKPKLQGQRLFGLPILSFEEAAKHFGKFEIDTVLVAIPNAGFVTWQKIVSDVSDYSLEIKTIPSLASLIDGSAKITEFKDVAIEDLLGREKVDPLPELLGKNIIGKTVLVTGAGGSIGSELCRQIIQLKPQKLLMMDVSELAIYTITEELKQLSDQLAVQLVPFIGSVQDRPFVTAAMQRHQIDTVYHAAAYKHVPLMEQNILQALKNNTIGTLILAEAAIFAKVTGFFLISTDKAVNPSNVMGASKRLAERVCQMMNHHQKDTRFSMVRFGNVLGSSGSVVPLFKKQIAEGGPITLTHPEVTRYFMTITEAVQLVIQASALAKGGEVFVLDMGKPVKIRDLAFKMVQLSGLRPYLESEMMRNGGDIAVRILGLRPGEKMYEELTYGDNLVGTAHPRIMTVNEEGMPAAKLKEAFSRLEKLIKDQDYAGLEKIMTVYADYRPEAAPAGEQVLPPSATQPGKIVPLPLQENRG